MPPHTRPRQSGQLNDNPREGGEFQCYLGTKEKAAERARRGEPLDPGRIVSPDMPGGGFEEVSALLANTAARLRAAGKVEVEHFGDG